MSIGSFHSGNVDEIVINIDADAIGQFLADNPAFIKMIALAVRNELTKEVRSIGNLYGKVANQHLNNQTQPPTLNPNKTRRLN